MSISEYLEGLFSNDFARCYQCLLYLSGVDGSKLGPLLLQQWNDRAFNDYGAHYFFVRLIGLVSSWPDDIISILEKLLLEAVDNLRPQFSKSRPAALLSLLNLSSKIILSFLIDILESSSSSWQLQWRLSWLLSICRAGTADSAPTSWCRGSSFCGSRICPKKAFARIGMKKALQDLCSAVPLVLSNQLRD